MNVCKCCIPVCEATFFCRILSMQICNVTFGFSYKCERVCVPCVCVFVCFAACTVHSIRSSICGLLLCHDVSTMAKFVQTSAKMLYGNCCEPFRNINFKMEWKKNLIESYKKSMLRVHYQDGRCPCLRFFLHFQLYFSSNLLKLTFSAAEWKWPHRLEIADIKTKKDFQKTQNDV